MVRRECSDLSRINDFQINSYVRRVLTRHWLDLKKIRYSAIGGVVYLRGTIDVMYGAPMTREGDWEGVTARYIDKIEKDIRQIPDVKSIRFEFEDWRKAAGRWTQIG
jgi:hypothetical protein